MGVMPVRSRRGRGVAVSQDLRLAAWTGEWPIPKHTRGGCNSMFRGHVAY